MVSFVLALVVLVLLTLLISFVIALSTVLELRSRTARDPSEVRERDSGAAEP